MENERCSSNINLEKIFTVIHKEMRELFGFAKIVIQFTLVEAYNRVRNVRDSNFYRN